jgi:hypothetical protein
MIKEEDREAPTVGLPPYARAHSARARKAVNATVSLSSAGGLRSMSDRYLLRLRHFSAAADAGTCRADPQAFRSTGLRHVI